MMKTKEQIAEERIWLCVRSYLMDNNLVTQYENVILMPKAFKINRVIRWCVRKKLKKQITDAGVQKHYRAMDRFIKEEIDLIWNPKGYWDIQRKKPTHLTLSKD